MLPRCSEIAQNFAIEIATLALLNLTSDSDPIFSNSVAALFYTKKNRKINRNFKQFFIHSNIWDIFYAKKNSPIFIVLSQMLWGPERNLLELVLKHGFAKKEHFY